MGDCGRSLCLVGGSGSRGELRILAAAGHGSVVCQKSWAPRTLTGISSDDGSLRISRMNYTLSSPLYALPQYGSILVSGVDAVTYLQGQLSFDVTLLTPKRMELATCN